MTGLFGRLANAFVAPPAVEPDVAGERRRAAGRRGRDPRERAAPSPASVAVLCRPEDALVVGGGIALLLAARCRASHALVAVWGGEGPPPLRAPAAAAARRLTTTLSERGHDAAASGRLVMVRLDEDLNAAAAEAVRAGAVSGEVPVVVVLAGARDAAADPLLRAQDAVLVAVAAGGEPVVAELAVAGLASLGVDARVVEVPAPAAAARALAAAGVAVVTPLRAALDAGLEGVG